MKTSEYNETRKITPLQSLGCAPILENLDDNLLFPPTFTRGNNCARCSFVTSNVVAAVDDNLLKLYDVQAKKKIIQPLSESIDNVTCPIQHLVCNAQRNIIVVVKIIISSKPTTKHTQGWVGATLSLDVLQTIRGSSLAKSSHKNKVKIGSLVNKRFKLELTAQNAEERNKRTDCAPAKAELNAARLKKIQRQRHKTQSTNSQPNIQKLGNPKHRVGNKNEDSAFQTSQMKIHENPGTKEQSRRSGIQDTELSFSRVKHIHISLDNICLDDYLNRKHRPNAQRSYTAGEPSTASEVLQLIPFESDHGVIYLTPEEAYGRAMAKLKQQIHESIEMCNLSTDCTLFACKLGLPFQRLILVEINVNSKVEPVVISQRCKSRMDYLTLHPFASFYNVATDAMHGDGGTAEPELCSSTSSQLRFWSRTHSTLKALRPIETVKNSQGHCWLSSGSHGGRQPYAFVVNAATESVSTSDNVKCKQRGDKLTVIRQPSTPISNNDVQAKKKESLTMKSSCNDQKKSSDETAKKDSVNLSIKAKITASGKRCINPQCRSDRVVIQIISIANGEPKLMFDIKNPFQLHPAGISTSNMRAKSFMVRRKPDEDYRNEATENKVDSNNVSKNNTKLRQNDGNIEKVALMCSSGNVLSIMGTKGTLIVLKFALSNGTSKKSVNSDGKQKFDGQRNLNGKNIGFNENAIDSSTLKDEPSYALNVGQWMNVKCLFNSRSAPELRLPLKSVTKLQLSPDKSLLLLHTCHRVAKLLRISTKPSKAGQRNKNGRSNQLITARFDHKVGHCSIFGADSWTGSFVADSSLAKTLPYIVTLSDLTCQSQDYQSYGHLGGANIQKINVWDFLSGVQHTSFLPFQECKSIPLVEDVVANQARTAGHGVGHRSACIVKCISMHPTGHYLLLGCQKESMITACVYTVLVNTLALLYEVDCTPQVLMQDLDASTQPDAGLELFSEVNVSFSDEGNLWACATYDTVNIYKTLTPFGNSTPELVVSFEARCAHIVWALNDCALVACEGNPISFIRKRRPSFVTKMDNTNNQHLISRNRTSSAQCVDPDQKADNCVFQGGAKSNEHVWNSLSETQASMDILRGILDEFSADPGRAIVWQACEPKSVKVMDQLQLKSLELFNIAQVAHITSAKATRRVTRSRSRLRRENCEDAQYMGNVDDRQADKCRALARRAQRQSMMALKTASYTCADCSYNDLCLVYDDYSPLEQPNNFEASGAQIRSENFDQSMLKASKSKFDNSSRDLSNDVASDVVIDEKDASQLHQTGRDVYASDGYNPTNSIDTNSNNRHNHPHIRNDGYSTLLAWVKIAGVHPRSAATTETKKNVESSTSKSKKRRAIKTKTRVFRVGGYRRVTSIVVRESCMVMGTECGVIDLFAWPKHLDAGETSKGTKSMLEAMSALQMQRVSTSKAVAHHSILDNGDHNVKRMMSSAKTGNFHELYDDLPLLTPISSLTIGPSPISNLQATTNGIYGQSGFDVFASTESGYLFQCYVGEHQNLSKRLRLLDRDQSADNILKGSIHEKRNSNKKNETNHAGVSEDLHFRQSWQAFEKHCLINRDVITQLQDQITKQALKIESMQMHSQFKQKSLREVHDANITALLTKHKAELETLEKGYLQQKRKLTIQLNESKQRNGSMQQKLERRHHEIQVQLENKNFQLRQELSTLKTSFEDLTISKEDQEVEFQDKIDEAQTRAHSMESEQKRVLQGQHQVASQKLQVMGEMYEETLHQEIAQLQQREKHLLEQMKALEKESKYNLQVAEQNLKHKTAEMGRILHRHIKNAMKQPSGEYQTTQADLADVKQALQSSPHAAITPQTTPIMKPKDGMKKRQRQMSKSNSELQLSSKDLEPTKISPNSEELHIADDPLDDILAHGPRRHTTVKTNSSDKQNADDSVSKTQTDLTKNLSDNNTLLRSLSIEFKQSSHKILENESQNNQKTLQQGLHNLNLQCQHQFRVIEALKRDRNKDRRMWEVRLSEKDLKIQKLEEEVVASVLEIKKTNSKLQAGETKLQNAERRMRAQVKAAQDTAKRRNNQVKASQTYAVHMHEQLEEIIADLKVTKPSNIKQRLSKLHEVTFDVAHGRGLNLQSSSAAAASRANVMKAYNQKLQRHQMRLIHSDTIVSDAQESDKEKADNFATKNSSAAQKYNTKDSILGSVESKTQWELQQSIESSRQLKIARALEVEREAKLQDFSLLEAQMKRKDRILLQQGAENQQLLEENTNLKKQVEKLTRDAKIMEVSLGRLNNSNNAGDRYSNTMKSERNRILIKKKIKEKDTESHLLDNRRSQVQRPSTSSGELRRSNNSRPRVPSIKTANAFRGNQTTSRVGLRKSNTRVAFRKTKSHNNWRNGQKQLRSKHGEYISYSGQQQTMKGFTQGSHVGQEQNSQAQRLDETKKRLAALLATARDARLE